MNLIQIEDQIYYLYNLIPLILNKFKEENKEAQNKFKNIIEQLNLYLADIKADRIKKGKTN